MGYTTLKIAMSRRIIMAVTNDLATDQRADRSCRALKEAGYEVTLVGRRLRESPDLEEREYRTVRMRMLFRRSALFYAEYNVRLLLRLLVMSADAFYANDSDTLLACCWAARLRRRTSAGDKIRLLFDAHELFPDVPELVDKPRVQSVWRWVERRCLPRVDAAFTVSQSVADEYRQRYGVTMTVVRNLPERANLEPNTSSPKTKSQIGPYVLLYQGAVNVGRGVRELIDVMRLLPECRLEVIGDGDLLEELRTYTATLPWANHIDLYGRMLPKDLHKITSSMSLGVCLLEDLGESYRCALPNRVGDFAQAGVPLLATGFVEIRRVLEEYGIGAVTEPCPTTKEGDEYEQYLERLAATIMATLHQWEEMPQEERDRRFERARRELCWEREKHLLTDAANASFSNE